MSLGRKITLVAATPARRISLSIATQKMSVEISETDLTFRWERATIQTLPGPRRMPHSTGAFSYDHMFDHNRLRRTWRQRRKERRRASFPERKGSNGFHAHVTPGSNPFGTRMPGVRVSPLGPIKAVTALCRYCFYLYAKWKYQENKNSRFALIPVYTTRQIAHKS